MTGWAAVPESDDVSDGVRADRPQVLVDGVKSFLHRDHLASVGALARLGHRLARRFSEMEFRDQPGFRDPALVLRRAIRSVGPDRRSGGRPVQQPRQFAPVVPGGVPARHMAWTMEENKAGGKIVITT